MAKGLGWVARVVALFHVEHVYSFVGKPVHKFPIVSACCKALFWLIFVWLVGGDQSPVSAQKRACKVAQEG